MADAPRGERRSMSPDEAWTNAELMRAVTKLTSMIEQLQQTLDRDYLRRDVADERYRAFKAVMDAQGEEVVNVGADLARLRKEISDNSAASWIRWVVPIVSSFATALIGAIIVLAMHGGHA